MRAYLNGLKIFSEYLNERKSEKVPPKLLEVFFHHCKKEWGYSYSMKQQLLASVKFLYNEVLHGELDFNFNVKMKKSSKIPVVLSV